jgi:hypothetical protein
LNSTHFGALSRRAWLIAWARSACLLMWLLAATSAVRAQIEVESRLTGQGATYLDTFGLSVSLDGNTMAVGAPGQAVNGNSGQGAVYVFTKVTQGWTQTAELTASDGAAGDSFGISVSLSGNTLAVGADEKAPNGNSGEGAVYVFTKTATGWTQAAGLTPRDGGIGYRFGSSVSLSGSTLAVGAPESNYRHSREGAVYVFTESKNGWNQTAELTTLDGAANDALGWSVSLSDGTLAVGAPNKNNVGAAYVFTLGATGWTQRAELTVTGKWTRLPEFGSSVSLSGNTLAVSDPDEAVSGSTYLGAVYIYTQGAAGWTQTDELTDPDGPQGFGRSISLNGSTLAVGGYVPTTGGSETDILGTICVFTQSAAGWQQTDERSGVLNDGFGWAVSLSGNTMAVGAPDVYGIRAPGPGAVYTFASGGEAIRPTGGATTDDFGSSVSVNGSTMAVGAPYETVKGNNYQGAVYVFTHTTKGWAQVAELTAADGAASDYFGRSVSLSGSTLAVVGAGPSYQTQVYLFTKTATGWKQTAELTDAKNPLFGGPVSLSGSTLAVGAPDTTVNGNVQQGVVYLFTSTVTGWKQAAKLTSSDGATYDTFGSSISLSGNTLAVGARSKIINGNAGQGAVYLFTKTTKGWKQTAELVAADGAAYDIFGCSVSLSGSTLAVGAYDKTVNGDEGQGTAYLFTSTAIGWTQTAELTALDAGTPRSTGAYTSFGQSVSLSGNSLVIGAPGKDAADGRPYEGAAYLFTLVPTGWSWTAELTPSSPIGNDQFGSAVSLSGNLLAIGGNLDTPVYTLP